MFDQLDQLIVAAERCRKSAESNKQAYEAAKTARQAWDAAQKALHASIKEVNDARRALLGAGGAEPPQDGFQLGWTIYRQGGEYCDDPGPPGIKGEPGRP